jgi:hypothetical protein
MMNWEGLGKDVVVAHSRQTGEAIPVTGRGDP